MFNSASCVRLSKLVWIPRFLKTPWNLQNLILTILSKPKALQAFSKAPRANSGTVLGQVPLALKAESEAKKVPVNLVLQNITFPVAAKNLGFDPKSCVNASKMAMMPRFLKPYGSCKT